MPHATASASPAGLSLARALFWGGIALAVVFLGAATAVAIVALSEQPITFLAVVPVFLFIFALFASYPIMFGAFRLQAEKRMRTVAALHPDAFLLHVVMRPKIAGQFRAAAGAFGRTATGVPWNNYAVFVADRESMGIYGGDGTLRVALPTAALVQATYQPVTIGIRTLTEFILVFADQNGQHWPIELLPVRWPGVVMRSVPVGDFAVEYAAMQAATHPGV